VSKTFKNRAATRLRPNESGDFRCRHCRNLIGALPSGGRHRNHCPLCLYSRHVDAKAMGDRASSCGSSMAPIASFVRPNGEHAIVHRCLGCGVERHNRIAADDNFELVLALPIFDPQATGAGLPIQDFQPSA
jgi:hypothetical protein